MPGLMLNEDDSHFYCCHPVDKLCREGVDELVDHYISPQMRELVFAVNAARANFPSEVWPRVWDGFDPDGGLDQPRLARLPTEWRETSFKVLRRLPALDLPQYWIDSVRRRGGSPWLSVRMNDVHDVDQPDLPHHSDFWRNNPQYWRVPNPNRPLTGWTDRAFDYLHQPVRDHFMKLIRELFERYDFDGLELDWMRFPDHIRPGFEEQGRLVLVDFHRQVRELARRHGERRGHPIKVGVRVPSRPWTARGMGLDAVAWAKEGLVDLIVATPFWVTAEFDIPIECWKEMLGPSPVLLAAGLEINLRPSPKVWAKYPKNMSNSAETVFGAAASFLHRGADRVYLFNYMDNGTTVDNPDDYPRITKGAGELSTAVAGPRRHVVTYSDTWVPGEPVPLALPAQCDEKMPARFRIHVGPKPTSGIARIIVGLGENGSLDIAALNVWVNGERCEATDRPLPSPIHPVVQKACGFQIPRGALHDGYNFVEVFGRGPDAHELFWAEIMIEP